MSSTERDGDCGQVWFATKIGAHVHSGFHPHNTWAASKGAAHMVLFLSYVIAFPLRFPSIRPIIKNGLSGRKREGLAGGDQAFLTYDLTARAGPQVSL